MQSDDDLRDHDVVHAYWEFADLCNQRLPVFGSPPRSPSARLYVRWRRSILFRTAISYWHHSNTLRH